ncbi:MAG: tRNA lysidine(34) synthetase TilS [Oscillospiraceae bacterium]
MCPQKDAEMKINDFCDKYNMLPSRGIVLCAVSGGKDSMALLEQLLCLALDYNYGVHCAHFNHLLRGDEALRDQAFVADYCKTHKIPCHLGQGDVRAFASEKGLGIEEAARILRYEFLEKTAEEIGAVRIATAHTADDNAETLLFNLSRGSGLKGLCGIPPVRGKFIRPLLQTTGAEVLQFLEDNQIPHLEDSTNALDDCSRNRLRHSVIPALRKINPAFDESSARCMALLRQDEEYLASLAQDFVEENFKNNSLPASKLSALPPSISARVLQSCAPAALSFTHIEALRELASSKNPHAALSLPGFSVGRSYDKLVFNPPSSGKLKERILSPGTITPIPEAQIEIYCELTPNCTEIHNSFNNFSFKSDSICGKIFVKSRSPGEKIRLLGRGSTKTLKKLFSEAKLNDSASGLIPVFSDELGVIAVSGFGIAERCAPKIGDDLLSIEIKPSRS